MKIYDNLSKQRELFQEIEARRNEVPYKKVNEEFATYKFEPQYLISLFEILENNPEEVCGSDEVLNRVGVSFSDITHAREIIEKGIYNSIKDLLLASPTATLELLASKGFSHIYVPVKIKKLNEKPTCWHILPIYLYSSAEEVKTLYGKGRMSQREFEALQTDCQKTISRKPESDDISAPRDSSTQTEKLRIENNQKTQFEYDSKEQPVPTLLKTQNGWEKHRVDSIFNYLPAFNPWLQVIVSVLLVAVPVSLWFLGNSFWSMVGIAWIFLYYPIDYLFLRFITPFFCAFWLGWGKAPWWMPFSAKIRNIFIEKKETNNTVRLKIVEFKKTCGECETTRALEVEQSPIYSVTSFVASCREKRAYHREKFKPF